jgi:hypothetical protein
MAHSVRLYLNSEHITSERFMNGQKDFILYFINENFATIFLKLNKEIIEKQYKIQQN